MMCFIITWPKLFLVTIVLFFEASETFISDLHAETLKIGFVTTLSTPGKSIGEDLRDGFLLGLELIDRKVGDVTIEAIIADDAWSDEIGLQATKKLIEEDKVDLLTGFIGSNVIIPASEYALAAGRIVISANAGPSIRAGRGCHPNFFALSHQNDQMPQAIGKLIAERGFSKAYVIVPDFAAGKDMAKGFERGFTGKIVGRTDTGWMPNPETDFEPIFKKARDAGADTIFAFYPGGQPGFEFLRQYKASGLIGDIALVTSFTIDEISLRRLQQNNIGGVWGMLTVVHWAANLKNDENARFVVAFAQRYGRQPSNFAAQGYDVVQLLRAALQSVHGEFRDQAKFREALRTVSWTSTRGVVRFGANQFPRQNLYLATVVDGDKGWTVKAFEAIEENAVDPYASECPASAE